MKWLRMVLALGLMLPVLQSCAGAHEARLLELNTGAGDSSEPLASRPRFPRPRGSPSTPKPAPTPKAPPAAKRPDSPEKPPAAQASPQAQPQRKPSPVEAVMTRWLDPKIARRLFDQGVEEARQRYPNLCPECTSDHARNP